MGPNEYESGGGGGRGDVEDPDARVVKKPITSLANASGAPVIPQSLGDLADKLPGRVVAGGEPTRIDMSAHQDKEVPPQITETSNAPIQSLEQVIGNLNSAMSGASQSPEQPLTSEQHVGGGRSIMPPPTEIDKQSQLQREIQSARAKIAEKIVEWKSLPDETRAEHVEKFIARFSSFAEATLKGEKKGKKPGGIFQKLAAQVAEAIEQDVIPGVEPFTKGVLILAFTDMALPPSISLSLTKLFGEYLSGRIEGNLQKGANSLRKVFGVLDEAAKTPEEKGFIQKLKERFLKDNPEAQAELSADGVETTEAAAEEPEEGATPSDEQAVADEADEDPVTTDPAPPVPPIVPQPTPGDPNADRSMNPVLKGDADHVARAHARLADRVDKGGPAVLIGGGDPNDPDNPETIPPQERESQPGKSGYFTERRDVGAEIQHAKTELRYQQSQGKIPTIGDLSTQGGRETNDRELNRLAMEQVGSELTKVIKVIEISGQRRFFLEFDVLDPVDCDIHGKDSTSIVVQLNRAGLLGNFTDSEKDIIRSFDPRFLYPPGEPELFQEKIKKMLDESQDDPNLTPEQMQARFQGKYDDYKSTLTQVMYTLIAGKVEGADADTSDTSATLAKIIQKRLAELKLLTKHPSYDSTLLVPSTTRVNIRKREAVSSIADVSRQETLYGGRTMYVEHSEAVPIARAISEDLIPTLEKIEKTVGYANKLRNTTHSSANMTAVAEAARSADMAAIPEAIAQNKYLHYAMQEYIRALGQVVAQENHIPYSNFGLMKESGLEEAEELTVEGLMLRFPLVPPVDTEEIIASKALKNVRNALNLREEDELNTDPETDIGKQNIKRWEIEKQKQRNAETRRKKRYENDLELSVKVASGLHKGVGEYWSVLDASIGNDILTAHSFKEGDPTIGRLRAFAPPNSEVINKIIEMKRVEGNQFGKETGFGFEAVAAARYIGERLDTSKRTGLNKLLFDIGVVDLNKAKADVEDWDPDPDNVSTRRRLFGRPAYQRVQRKPDQTSQAEYLERARDMSEAERNGMTPELATFYREHMGVTQLMHKIPGDIPRSGGWRMDNNDSIDQKFVNAYTAEARRAELTGVAVHEHVMAKLSELGGDRLVVHYIGKNLESLMEFDREAKVVLDRYKAAKKRVTDAIANGSFAAQKEPSQDEIDLEVLTPVYDRAKDKARTLLLQKYVIKKRLEKNPEMALLYERNGFTPKGEKLIRRQLIDLVQSRAVNGGEISSAVEGQNRNYAVMYQCLPAFEVAIRSLHNAPEEETEAYRVRIKAYFKDKIESSHPVRIEKEGEPAVVYSPLRDILSGESVDDKTESMMRLFGLYEGKVQDLAQTDELSQRFAEQVVLGLGNPDAYLTSAGGFDYSSIQLDGLTTVKSASSGIEGNIALKKHMQDLEKVLSKLYLTGLESVKKTEDYQKIVTDIHNILDPYANLMSANPDEANVFYVRLAQIAVFSLREPAPGDKTPSVWFSGDTTQSGHGLNAEQRYYLLKALLRSRGISEKPLGLNPAEMARLTPAQQQDLRELESLPDDDGHIIGVTPLAKAWSLATGQTEIQSSRKKRAQRLADRGYFRGGALTYSVTMRRALGDCDVFASSLEDTEANARRARDVAAAAAK